MRAGARHRRARHARAPHRSGGCDRGAARDCFPGRARVRALQYSLVLGFTGGSVFTLVALTFYTVMRDSTPSPPFYVVFSALCAIFIVMLVCKEIDHLHKVRFLQKFDETVSHISTDMQLRNLLPPLNEWELHNLRARILHAVEGCPQGLGWRATARRTLVCRCPRTKKSSPRT